MTVPEAKNASAIGRFLSQVGISKDAAYFSRKKPLGQRSIMPMPADSELSISEQFYRIQAPIQDVFSAYTMTPPAEVWPAQRIVYHSLWAPPYAQPWDDSQQWPGLQLGMKLICDLKVIPPFTALRIYVGVEVTRIETDRCIRYDYLEDSVTVGYNEIRFIAESDGSTRLHHYSEYRGTSLRDRLLMPLMQNYLHVGFVDALHMGMAAKIGRDAPA
jgi:hypothetical protein